MVPLPAQPPQQPTPLPGVPGVPDRPHGQQASTSTTFQVPDHLAAITSRLAALQTDLDEARTPGERAGWLTGLRQLIDTAEVLFTQALSSFDALGDAPAMSAQRDSTAWLCNELRLAGGDARARVQLARECSLLAAPLTSVREGELRFDHVRAISAAVRPLRLLPQEQEAAVPLLHELARSADPARVRGAGRRIREAVDPDGALREHDRQFERRHLTLAPLLDGMTTIEGTLDAEGSATVAAALAPLMVPADATDARSAGQRRADALVEIASLALRSEQLPDLSGTVAALDVVVPVQAVVRAGVRHPRPAEGVGLVHDAPGGPVALSRDSVERLMCDSRIGRVLLGPDGATLDLGRRVRLFSPDQRRALTVRDGGCRFTGCTRPPRYTDAHHVVPWVDGGETDLPNAMLLCRWHHTLVHRGPGRGGWRVATLDARLGSNGALVFRGPAGQEIRSEPRAP